MSGSDVIVQDDAALAARLADAAGKILLEVRASGLIGGKALGKAGDVTANQFLINALREQRAEDGLLSEESKDTEERLSKSRVWIIDPVDGTREYGEERTDWAVHVALTVDGAPAIGAVALPGLGLVLRSDQPAPLPAEGTPLRMVVRRTRPAAEAVAVAQAHGLHCSRIDGSPLVYNQADTYMPDLLICRKEHAAMVLEKVKEAAQAA